MGLSKKKAQRKHAKRRLKERYNIKLSKKLRKSIISDIQKGRAYFLYKQSNRISIFSVQIKKHTVKVVYDCKRQEIVTFLYPQGENLYHSHQQAEQDSYFIKKRKSK